MSKKSISNADNLLPEAYESTDAGRIKHGLKGVTGTKGHDLLRSL